MHQLLTVMGKGEIDRMNLGFDIDGVISDFVRSFMKVVKRHYDVTLTEADIYCHDLNLVLGISKQDRNKLIRETILEELELNSGAQRILAKLSSEGHRIFILTARPSDLVGITENWLKKKGIPYFQLLQLEQGEKHLANVNLDLVVEDNLEDAIGWSQKVKKVLIYDHPWNRTLNVRNLVKRVYNWGDIYKEIEQLKVASLPRV